MPRARRLGVGVAAAVAAARLCAAQADVPDPWAPGTTVEPWPLITRLQRPAALGDDDAAWEHAVRHQDPVVRAAAAFAAGRAKPRGASALVAPLVLDPDILVRNAALWAALQLDDRAALAAIARAMAARRDLTRAGMGNQPSPGLAWLLARRGIPVGAASVEERRDWLERVDLATLERRSPADPWRETVQSMSWTAERAEWDADERATLRAVIEVSPGKEPLNLPLGTSLVSIDEPDTGPGQIEKRDRIPVTLRRTDAEPAAAISLDPGRTEVELSLALHDVPPGPYLMEGISLGHGLLLRVRRSPRREAEIQRAAQTAQTAAEIEAVGRYRVAAGAPRLRNRLHALLQAPPTTGPRPVDVWIPDPAAWPIARALGRLKDADAAGLLIGALRGYPTPWREQNAVPAHDPLVTSFGEAAWPHLERAAGAWREAAKARPLVGKFVVSVLGSRTAASPRLDETRIEVLAALGPRLPPPDPPNVHRQSPERDAFHAALVALAPRRPQDAGRALAALADRPAILARTLRAFDPPDYAGYPYAIDVDVIERVLLAAWEAMGPGAPAAARAALAGEAARLRIVLPGHLPAALPMSAEEAAQEISRALPHRALEAAIETLRRVVESGLTERDPDIARYAARLALDVRLYDESARLAERSLALSAVPAQRGPALVIRARARAAGGDREGQKRDLEEALRLLPGNREMAVEARQALTHLASETVDPRLRIRPRKGRFGEHDRAVGDGTVLVAGRDQRITRLDVASGRAVAVATAPWPVRALAPVGARHVVVVSADGRVAVFAQGDRAPVWQAQTAPWCRPLDPSRCGDLAADGQRIIVRDESAATAFDAMTGRTLWTRPAVPGPRPVLNGTEPVVFGIVGPDRYTLGTIVGVDPRDGRVRWSAEVNRWAQGWRTAAGRIAWIESGSTLRVLDVGSGLERIRLALPHGRGSTGSAAIAFSPDDSVLYAAVEGALFAVGKKGIVWSQVPPVSDAQAATLGLEAAADAVWWLVRRQARAELDVWSPSGRRIAARTWPAPQTVPRSLLLVDPRTVEIQVGDASELVDLLPPPR